MSRINEKVRLAEKRLERIEAAFWTAMAVWHYHPLDISDAVVRELFGARDRAIVHLAEVRRQAVEGGE